MDLLSTLLRLSPLCRLPTKVSVRNIGYGRKSGDNLAGFHFIKLGRLEIPSRHLKMVQPLKVGKELPTYLASCVNLLRLLNHYLADKARTAASGNLVYLTI